jgi:hypothetical protein
MKVVVHNLCLPQMLPLPKQLLSQTFLFQIFNSDFFSAPRKSFIFERKSHVLMFMHIEYWLFFYCPKEAMRNQATESTSTSVNLSHILFFYHLDRETACYDKNILIRTRVTCFKIKKQHGITSQKTLVLILTAIKPSSHIVFREHSRESGLPLYFIEMASYKK